MSIRPDLPAKNVTELSREQLKGLFQALGEPAFRAKQLYDWVHKKGVRSFDDMTNFPNRLRERLKTEGYSIGRVSIDQLLVSTDGTRKLSIRLSDDGVVETVLIPMGENEFT
jgi:23S rRNA (adenine2503-C2)-methyltransferase